MNAGGPFDAQVHAYMEQFKRTQSKEFKELGFLANFEATAKLNAQQYTILATAMTMWLDDHPGPEHAAWREVLESITFTRTR